jgi:hypothetical protein
MGGVKACESWQQSAKPNSDIQIMVTLIAGTGDVVV